MCLTQTSVELMYSTNDYNSKFKSLQMNDSGINGDVVGRRYLFSFSSQLFKS